jgi:hypothetical protein
MRYISGNHAAIPAWPLVRFKFEFVPLNFVFHKDSAAVIKIRKYRADYNNRPPSAVSFMPAIASTSGRLHSEFVRLFSIHNKQKRSLRR